MNHPLDPTGEASNHKLAAVFESRDGAEAARRKLIEETALDDEQIDVLDPGSEAANRALLPESHGIWRTLVRSHVVLGIAGAVAGLALFLVLDAFGVRFVSDNPLAALGVFVLVLTLFGLMLGGLLTLRPDQVPYVRVAREALQAGHSVVVVHARGASELGDARSLLERPALKAVRTA
jgi:hypothetical protein